jgi:MoxR-like ATPase
MSSNVDGIDMDLARAAAVVDGAVAAARAGLVDRELIAEVTVLCAVAGEHLLVIGPPGTGKSEAVRRVAGQLGGGYFEYLLGRFTEPGEIFGPVDLRRLREGVVEVETAGMLPEAEIAFLDEVFLGSTAILNTLLGILNERVFRRGSSVLACPLRVCVGAANTLPDNPALAAFADRFLARVFIDPIPDTRLEELLEVGWRSDRPSPSVGGSLLPAVDRLAAAARACDLSAARPAISVAVRRLRAAGVTLSDRRIVRSQRLVAAAAALDGRTTATADDLWVLPIVAPTADLQATAREALADLLGTAGSRTLAHAADELARGPRARADRLTASARSLLGELGGTALGPDDRLRLEAVLREIDAGFTPAALPAPLGEVRAALVAAVGG